MQFQIQKLLAEVSACIAGWKGHPETETSGKYNVPMKKVTAILNNLSQWEGCVDKGRPRISCGWVVGVGWPCIFFQVYISMLREYACLPTPLQKLYKGQVQTGSWSKICDETPQFMLREKPAQALPTQTVNEAQTSKKKYTEILFRCLNFRTSVTSWISTPTTIEFFIEWLQYPILIIKPPD